ncbi:hypothetical protein [Deinococcus sp. QL22]|uniref:hypothetical protein n=1 Tax=Deinococcus sp. QL22 TaxID=2939437 RepID=UPI002016B8E9|nr:hypothetical protein [Deinococcus sp. QL22]UQN10291.1 hypothetical protein M1R55_29510 [Deinococcus sp. QL22]UQN10425.1 hypothetical protein M1R55_28835 [Deinococcus sp. QL22]
MPLPLHDPAAFDALLNSGQQVEWWSAPEDEAISMVRRTQLALAKANPQEWGALLNALSDITAYPAQGVRMLIQVALRLYDDVLAARVEITGHSPLELENTCLVHSALGMAAVQRKQYQRAQEHLMVAVTLAQSLGLQYRLQALEFEWQRVRNIVGLADPAKLKLMLMRPMSSQRRNFGQRTLAGSFMSLGAYGDALMALGTHDNDTVHDAGLREFLHVLCMLPPARSSDDALLSPNDSWFQLATALRGLINKEEVPDLSAIEYEPQATYARHMASSAMKRVPKLAGAALHLLGDTPPLSPDQGVPWALLGLSAAADGVPIPNSLKRIQTLEEQLPRLLASAELSRIYRLYMPEQLVLLMLSPLAPLAQGWHLNGQALLCGQTVIAGSEEIKLPGRTGRTVVLEAIGIAERDELARSERKRLQEGLAAFGGERVVNLGRVLRAYGLIASSLKAAGEPVRHAEWALSIQRIEDMLSPDVQSVLSLHRPEYLC